MEKEIIRSKLDESSLVSRTFLSSEDCHSSVELAAETMITAINKGGKFLTYGNGGSSICDTMHFAEELKGKLREERKALSAIALSETSHITCVGNDYGFEHVFSRYVQGLEKQDNTLLAISASDISGGKLANLSDVEIRVPRDGYSDRIQEMHINVIHKLNHLIEQKIV